jgi:hypothetical protein
MAIGPIIPKLYAILIFAANDESGPKPSKRSLRSFGRSFTIRDNIVRSSARSMPAAETSAAAWSGMSCIDSIEAVISRTRIGRLERRLSEETITRLR